MNDIKIRNNLKIGDVGSIIYLHGVLYAKEYGYDYTFEAYVGEPLSQFVKRNNPREKIWIVEKEKILGSIAICEASEVEAQLRWFLISPELRGKGYGKQLVKKAIKFSEDQGYKSIQLWTVKDLEAAKNIYLSNGFKLEEEVEHSVWGSNQIEQKYTKYLSLNKALKQGRA